MIKRVSIENSCGILVDVQEFFLAALPREERARVERATAGFTALLHHLRVPVLATIERPIDKKGGLAECARAAAPSAKVLEKDFFDLTKERPIQEFLAGLGKKQLIVGGCETDVCVLQSCLGLLALGYEVFIVEDLLFSSSAEVGAAKERMKAAGAVFLTYKTLFHELLLAVDSSEHRNRLVAQLGPLPALSADLS